MPTCLITGANRGIGLELTRRFIERGDAVIAVCRHPSPELEALHVEIVEGVDAADPDSVHRLADQLEGRRIELLVKGARCAACLSKIERGIKALPGVEDARLNLTTGKLAVRVADRRLYAGKHSGRNVVVWNEADDRPRATGTQAAFAP